MTMTAEQQKSILTVCLLAAFSDGANDEKERSQLKQITESLGNESADAAALNLPQVYQDVLTKKATLDSALPALSNDESKHLAYEMAVHIIDADGRQTSAETAFLETLRAKLGMDSATANALAKDADSIAEAAFIPNSAKPALESVGAVAIASAAASGNNGDTHARALANANVSEAELDKTILNYAILNGALEMLPQSWASMAIIPLQTRMVYNIGKSYGYELGTEHIKELLGTVGVGLASQYLEQAGKKLLGGLFGKMLGKSAGGILGSITGSIASNATSMAFSFATTYALGQLAKRYYGSGRTMSTAVLKQTFDQLVAPAKGLQAQYAPQIAERARSINMTEIMNMVKGKVGA